MKDSNTVTINKDLLQRFLDSYTDYHTRGLASFMGPTEDQHQVLLALGYTEDQCDRWAKKHYG